MFGSQKDKQKKEEKETLMKRKNSLLERYQKAFDKIEESREDIEENFEKLVNGSVKQDQDLSDVVDSIKAAQQANSKMVDTVQSAIAVIEKQADLMQKKTQEMESAQNQMKGGLDEGQLSFLQTIVNGGTDIDKTNRELVSIGLKYENTYQDMSDLVQSIERLDDQMSVTSLNAAVEANKIGPRGRKLIKASEDVKSLVQDYGEATKGVLDIFESFSELIEGTRSQVDQLVDAVKENNQKLQQLLDEVLDGADESRSSDNMETASESDVYDGYDTSGEAGYEEDSETHYDSYEDELEAHYGEFSDPYAPDYEQEQTSAEQSGPLEDYDEYAEPEEEYESEETEEEPNEPEEEQHFEADTYADDDMAAVIDRLNGLLDIGEQTEKHHQDAVRQMIHAGGTFMEQQKIMQQLENVFEGLLEEIHLTADAAKEDEN